MPAPKGTQAVHVNVDDDLKIKIQNEAKKHDRSLGSMCRIIIMQYFSQKEMANNDEIIGEQDVRIDNRT